MTAAVAPPRRRSATAARQPLLDVRDLRTYFKTDDGIVQAVDGVSFAVRPGQTLGVVGESGSGKSVTMMSILSLNPKPGRMTLRPGVEPGRADGGVPPRGRRSTPRSRRARRSSAARTSCRPRSGGCASSAAARSR